jgi:hypothetical protein
MPLRERASLEPARAPSMIPKIVSLAAEEQTLAHETGDSAALCWATVLIN